jgi:hypothetical protein
MDAHELLYARAWRFVVHEKVVQLPDVQQLLDCIQAGGLLRMAVAHLVATARRVRNERHGHDRTRLAVTRDGLAGV